MKVADRNRELRVTVVLAVVCLVLQLALAPNVALGNGRANFALVFSACIALTQGGVRGVLCGFISGLLFDLTSTNPIGLMAFCLTATSFLMGLSQRDRMAGDLAGSVVSFACAALAVSLVYHLALLLVGQADSLLDVIVFRALPSTLLTVVAFLPFAYLLSRVRVSGGSSLGGGRGKFSGRGL